MAARHRGAVGTGRTYSKMRERPPSRRKIRTVLTDKGRPFADLPRNRSGHTMPMRRLVLMHTPAHAAGEIARLMKAVREDRMPLDDTGIEQPLDPALKRALRS